jgi:hypothetical protein
LQQLLTEIDPQRFFQLDRQVIASRNYTKTYNPTAMRKLVLTLHPEVKEEVFVSKVKAKTFMKWLKNS